jgi:amidase
MTSTALELAAKLRRREVSAVELAQEALAGIRACRLGAWVSVDDERVLRDARLADRRIAAGDRAPFLGVPTGIKDQEHLRGHRTRLGSRAFRWLYAPWDGFAARTCRAAGFTLLGKLACSELTILPIIDSPPVRNPHARDRYAGGSSGGSAAAVGAGTIAIAPASDGGGSIRIPAAFCGLVGVKPGRGTLPDVYGRFDPVGLSTIGPLARSVRDAAALMDVLAGTHHRFTAACDGAVPKLRVRVLVRTPIAPVDVEIADATTEVARRLEALGHSLADADPIDGAVDDFIPLMASLVAQVPLVLGMKRRVEPTTRWLHDLGKASSRQAAIAAGRALGARVLAWFGDADVIVTPTVGLPPPVIGSFAKLDGEGTFRAVAPIGAFTAPFNVSGQPAISLPLARSRAGLPIGIQLVGRPGSDHVLLALATQLSR